MAANDNPYADWALGNYEANLDWIIKRLGAEIEGEGGHDIFKKLKQCCLRFRSPYRYKVAQLIVTYDYFIRVQKSLE